MSSKRKLAAILSADAVGYSRMMGEDERVTLETLTEYRKLMGRRIAEHDGRVVDSPGDALLAEFPSAVEAVQAAVEVQQELARRNAELATARRMLFRIGVNLGDVLEQDGALYGDGVNIAARLESLAAGGGICVSGTVFDQVEGKLAIGFKFAGEQQVKNIAKPVRAYHVIAEGAARRAGRAATRRRVVLAAAGAVLFAVIAAAGWRGLAPRQDGSASAADPALAMPAGPTIAVLPFTNMSGDPTQDYFSDGLTEDIITELARFRDLNVLARNTTFQYKGQAVDVPALGRKTGARYVVEGSVRKSGSQLRITAQLIDAATGSHLWAEKYDRDLVDVFVVQDEIANRIAAVIAGGDLSILNTAVRDTARRKNPAEVQAYELVLQGSHFKWTPEGYRQAKAHLQRAIELAPNYARARRAYAYTTLYGWVTHLEAFPIPPADILQNAIRSVALDPGDAWAHGTAAVGYFFAKDLDQFNHHARTAIELAPNDTLLLAELGALMSFSGDWERGVALVTKSHLLNPASTYGWYESALHYDYFRRGLFREALDIVRAHPGQEILHTQWKYVAAYAELGDLTKAREHFEMCVRIDPAWSANRMQEELRLWNFPEWFTERYLRSYAKAGYTLRPERE